MSNRRKRYTRTLAAKLNISYQAADNIRKAGRRNGAAVAAGGEDVGNVQPAEEHKVSEASLTSQGTSNAPLATDEDEREVEPVQDHTPSRDDVVRFAHPFVANSVAGWSALVATSAVDPLLRAVAGGAVAEEIEHELTRAFDRARPMTLRQSRLPRSGAKYVAAPAATARLVGHEPPTTFGDLLRLLIRLGVVIEQAGRYTLAFPPPTPEDTLPLTAQ